MPLCCSVAHGAAQAAQRACVRMYAFALHHQRSTAVPAAPDVKVLLLLDADLSKKGASQLVDGIAPVKRERSAELSKAAPKPKAAPLAAKDAPKLSLQPGRKSAAAAVKKQGKAAAKRQSGLVPAAPAGPKRKRGRPPRVKAEVQRDDAVQLSDEDDVQLSDDDTDAEAAAYLNGRQSRARRNHGSLAAEPVEALTHALEHGKGAGVPPPRDSDSDAVEELVDGYIKVKGERASRQPRVPTSARSSRADGSAGVWPADLPVVPVATQEELDSVSMAASAPAPIEGLECATTCTMLVHPSSRVVGHTLSAKHECNKRLVLVHSSSCDLCGAAGR